MINKKILTPQLKLPRRRKTEKTKRQNSTGSPHSDTCEVPIYKPNWIGFPIRFDLLLKPGGKAPNNRTPEAMKLTSININTWIYPMSLMPMTDESPKPYTPPGQTHPYLYFPRQPHLQWTVHLISCRTVGHNLWLWGMGCSVGETGWYLVSSLENSRFVYVWCGCLGRRQDGRVHQYSQRTIDLANCILKSSFASPKSLVLEQVSFWTGLFRFSFGSHHVWQRNYESCSSSAPTAIPCEWLRQFY